MKMKSKSRTILLCEHCIAAIRSRGERVYDGGFFMDADEAEESGITCEWCDEVDDLYECTF